ncbi:hypothetical protein OUZ56_006795 [Daphnia magna]|uniref:Uncharacterized protein n=1 Tax=Daphnia magna TaxID=35525 RepID=A0ABQ9YWS1_9CRUS|nr:hypothetical protein OUZ56_006795 [Daphnia magna]
MTIHCGILPQGIERPLPSRSVSSNPIKGPKRKEFIRTLCGVSSSPADLLPKNEVYPDEHCEDF